MHILLDKILGLKCVKCGQVYKENEVLYHCKKCGKEGILDVLLDYELIKEEMDKENLINNSEYSIWRYVPAIPIEKRENIQALKVGWTPLYEVKELRKILGIDKLFIKDDSRNPTASFKDRASAVGIIKAIEYGSDVICAASTGNAASSISGFAASAGMKNVIFVPKSAPIAKIVQLLVFGSTVYLVDGTYDQAYDLCYEVSKEFGWYNRSCAINPYLIEGKKTVAYEICEQLNWEVPDIVVMAVGDGCSIAAAWKGFCECYKLGLVDKLPRMIGVQAEQSNPVSRAFYENTLEFEYKAPNTIADSISVGIPRNGIKALNAITESNGLMIDVSDSEILDTIKFLARNTGIFGEPAGVTGFAGIRKLKRDKIITGTESIVTVVTGSGLKDIKSAEKAVEGSITVKPNLEDFKKVYQNIIE